MIDGFDIPYRELSEKEANMDITWQRFRDFHYAVGEDFLDTTGYGDLKLMSGWLIHKYPDISLDILDICNHNNELLYLSELKLFSYDEDKDIDKLYIEFAEFCNQTKHLKCNVNQILILVSEYYDYRF